MAYYGKRKGPPDRVFISPEEEYVLWGKRRRSKKARELLTRKYLCWAFRMAEKYRGPRLDFDEAIGAANEGLMKAMEKFDRDKLDKAGNRMKFIVFSYREIQRHLIIALVNTYPVKVGDHIRKQLAKLPEPSDDDVFAESNAPVKSLKELWGRLGDTRLFLDVAPEIDSAPGRAQSPDELSEKASESEELREALDSLTPLERAAVLGRHYDTPARSFESIRRAMKVSGSVVQAAYGCGMAKLRERLER
jgi:RNA polymerase sigma factor (sigma-70 family)